MEDDRLIETNSNDTMPLKFRNCMNVKCVALLSLATLSLGTGGVSLTMLITTSSNTALYTGLLTATIGTLAGLLINPKKILRK